MPFDGTTWGEARPDNNDFANEIDDYMRDDKMGVRSRMEHEHVWPSSQSATNQGGFHKFITLSALTSAPVLVYGTSTQLAAIWCSSGSKDIMVTDSAGSSYMLMKSAVGVTFFSGTGTIGSIPYVTSGGGMVQLAAATSGYVLTAAGANTAPSWAAISGLAGTWASGAAVGVSSQVTRDSWVTAILDTTVTTKTQATLKTDSNSTPTTVRDQINFDFNANNGKGSVQSFVKKNEYYLIETSGGAITVTTTVIPIGA